ncbi:MAG: biopolymer transport protein ExbD [Candidatus Poribacteria bacterium]|nr:MAG: biopolymer transport protein ExbD [Candidatus Poribacteria bacterium]
MPMNLKKREQAPPKLRMEPMVDCVFLLLIFFMVSNILRVPPPFKVDLPESKAYSEFARKRYNVYVDAIGRISVDEKMIPDLNALETFLRSKATQIETLIIKADKNALHGAVVDIMERAKRQGIDNIAIAVSEEEYQGEL